MEVKIKYSEIQDIVLQKFRKEVELTYVDSSTVSISTKVKILAFVKNIGINLHIEKVEECATLYIAYSGKMGIELLISPAIAFLKRLLTDNTSFITQSSGNKVIINLAEIEQLKDVLDKVTLKNIYFDEEHVVIEASLNMP